MENAAMQKLFYENRTIIEKEIKMCILGLRNSGLFCFWDIDEISQILRVSDIKKGLVDMVVVYKVDRLSRSLMDFAKIVELFEKHNVSFVSVTQHFNTKDSMGRLTLNILLSFAQFEREIISERTRDKITAARKKGKWVGGIQF